MHITCFVKQKNELNDEGEQLITEAKISRANIKRWDPFMWCLNEQHVKQMIWASRQVIGGVRP